MAESRRVSKFELTKHPLVVLAVSTLIGAILIPVVTARIAQQSKRAELRTAHAVQALRSSADTERLFNLVATELANFVKGERVADTKARAALRERVRELYAEFDRQAWWWHWSVLQEAQVLKLINDEEERRIKTEMTAYQDNLTQTVAALNPLWSLLVTEAANPGAKAVATALAAFEERTRALQAERAGIVARMIEPLTR